MEEPYLEKTVDVVLFTVTELIAVNSQTVKGRELAGRFPEERGGSSVLWAIARAVVGAHAVGEFVPGFVAEEGDGGGHEGAGCHV